ncbi:MAG: sensory rhodopsin transducer [Clostridiales bacterium]|nr:sensory rhodopsin transducer [Clostridiales bacterium]
MNHEVIGYKHYMFIDGDLPGNGSDPSLPGHEAMMIVNPSSEDAHILVNLYFEDKEPVKGLHLTIPAQRVICTRMDMPVCEEKYQIPFGQYSVELLSDIPVCASYGRLDRRHELGYYSTGYCAV